MIQFEYIIQDDLGIHARPAGIIAREAKKFQSAISFTKGEKTASTSQVFAMMSLGVKKGDTITVSVDGSDEADAAEGIRRLLEEHL